jgi:hypothetical protein
LTLVTFLLLSFLCSTSISQVDKDSRVHMTWIHERAAARADLFNIVGLTNDKTMGGKPAFLTTYGFTLCTAAN